MHPNAFSPFEVHLFPKPVFVTLKKRKLKERKKSLYIIMRVSAWWFGA